MWAALLYVRRSRLPQTGDRFRGFLIGYLAFRLVIEAIKPVPFAYFGLVSGIQLLCLGGLCYYWRDMPRLARSLLMRAAPLSRGGGFKPAQRD
jgi:hypothetical protein